MSTRVGRWKSIGGRRLMTSDEPLTSWRATSTRDAIISFVSSVSTPGDGYVAPIERIATFDDDGTLWCEKRMYVQAVFIFAEWRPTVEADPALAAK